MPAFALRAAARQAVKIGNHNRQSTIDNHQNRQSAARNPQSLGFPPIAGDQLRRAGRLPPLFRQELMFECDDAGLELGEISEAFGRRQTVRPFHLEDVFACRCVESCDESRDAIAAFEKPNHVLLIGLTMKDGQTTGELDHPTSQSAGGVGNRALRVF
jgi:hypothetical protein